MATELEEFWKPLLAMVLYALLTLLVSVLTDKSRRFRYLAAGKPQVLLEDGMFHRESFTGGHIDLDEFLSRSRLAGCLLYTSASVDAGMPYCSKTAA